MGWVLNSRYIEESLVFVSRHIVMYVMLHMVVNKVVVKSYCVKVQMNQ